GSVREVFESAILMGLEAMKALGVPEAEIAEVERRYRENDQQRLAAQDAEGSLHAAKDLIYRPGHSMRDADGQFEGKFG
ncbi:MAG TPA: sodium:proton exchanger, partial [Rhizorhapis sp.]|nr:sodium:proton exchanger [Rhizorhapis sp.]